VTLTGPQLHEFERDGLSLPAFTAPGFDDHVKLIFASQGPIEDVLPRQLAHGIEWRPTPHLASRDYTPRRVDPVAGELDLEFVRHGTGPAATWADTAEPGSQLWLVGPKSSTLLPEEIDWVLLAGDETALPAIARFLDERPLDVPVRIVVNLPDDHGRITLRLQDGDTITWVVDPDPASLVPAVRQLDWPDGQVFAWAAGESRSLLPLRRFLTREKSVPRTHINVTGYWVAEPEEPETTSPATTGAGAAKTVAPAGPPEAPVEWFATRAAIRMGVLAELAGGPRSLADLATTVGIGEEVLVPLSRILVAAEVLSDGDGVLALGPVGDLIIDDEHVADSFDGLEADLVVSLADLDAAAHDGGPSWRRRHGRSLWAAAEAEAAVAVELTEQAERLRYLSTGITAAGLWPSLVAERAHVSLHGPGAAVVAEMLSPDLELSIVAGARFAAAQREQVGRLADRWTWLSEASRCDIAVVALGLEHRTDDEAADLLTRIGTVTRRAVLVESVEHDALNPHAAEDALLSVAAIGRPPRSVADLTALAGRTGWQVAAVTGVGWGVALVELSG